MKRITVFVLLVTLLAGLSACAGEKAGPIQLPNASDVESVKITQNKQVAEEADSGRISEIIERFTAVEPTTRASVQDVPNVADYIQIDLVLRNGNTSTLFVYQENGNWYIEQPYQGIYRAQDNPIILTGAMLHF